MTPQEINIAIAEFEGWTHVTPNGKDSLVIKGYSLDTPQEVLDSINTSAGTLINEDYWLQRVPDYYNDLNAIHKVELKLNDEQFYKYRDWLGSLMGWRYVSTQAEIRCEALLKTIGKWK